MDDNAQKTAGQGDLDRWKGHTKNIQPDSGFESEVKAAALPAKQQADRAAEITRENMASAQQKPDDKPPQPAMPTGTANSVYPDADRGVTSSQSQTPRFNFDDVEAPEGLGVPAKKKSFLRKIFGR
ncbi:MAG TPA: hypothetical protein VLG47_03895 [Candidatus Saccharimonadales bacterium]|nr:hypothetical protein [Candidatus Saccharimonadales bacterium]